jgi:hypothetical protein
MMCKGLNYGENIDTDKAIVIVLNPFRQPLNIMMYLTSYVLNFVFNAI